VKTTSIDAARDSAKFYKAQRTVIQRHGIYEPYTGRGTAKGLAHGLHNLCDSLATHILKQTGSREQAGYAIQGTPDDFQQHPVVACRRTRRRSRRKSLIRFGTRH